jgi:4-amino-4-deoxy-L-arabinose transferase-like glycosyltransferase
MREGNGIASVAVADRRFQGDVTDAAKSWRDSIWFIVAVAFLVRLAVIIIGHTYRITPRLDHFQYGWEMGRLARSIASGEDFSSPTDLASGPSAWAPPLYPYLLGEVFKVFGIYSAASAGVILTFNSVFSALTCLTVSRIGGRVYGAGVGRTAAWTWALFPYAIYWPTRVVWETSLTAFLLSLALLFTLRLDAPTRTQKGHATRAWILYGLLWGVIAVTNTAVVSMMPFCLLWLLQRGSCRSHLVGAVLCLLTTLLVMAPWLIRNYAVFGKFVFIRDNLPLELHMANNEHSAGLWTRVEHPGNNPESMRRFQELGEMRFMEEKQREVNQFIREHPGTFLLYSVERAGYFWIGPPQLNIVAGYDLQIARHIAFLLPAIFACAGLWLTIRKRKPGAFLFACFLLIYPIPYYMVQPFPRYKHPIEPEMILLAVYVFWEARRIQLRWPLFHKQA